MNWSWSYLRRYPSVSIMKSSIAVSDIFFSDSASKTFIVFSGILFMSSVISLTQYLLWKNVLEGLGKCGNNEEGFKEK